MKPVKCPNCDNEIVVDESSQYLSCGSCGKCYVNPYYVKKESSNATVEQNEKPKGNWRCVSCKAILPSDDSSPTLICPACGRSHKNPSYKPSQPAVVQDSTTKTATNVQENTKQNNKDDIHVISWAYCPQCGNSLDLKNSRTEAYCDHCKKNFVVKRTQNGAIHLEEKKQTVNVQQNIVNIQQNIVTAPAKVGESKFTGTYGSLLGNRIVNALISLLTIGFGIPWVICRSYRWEVDHTVIDGRRLKFDGTGGQLIGSWIKWMFLTLITCGIYGLWVPLKKRAWIVEHSHIEGFSGESKFTGGLASFLGLQIVNFFILVFTLGLGVPWVVCRSMKWDSEHQVIDGRRIYFDGNAAQLFGNWIKWILLTFITCGFYGFLLPIKKQAWIVKHQSFVKPVGNSGQSTGKLIDVNGQKKKDIGKIVGCVLAAACVIAVIVIVCVTVIIPNIPARHSGGSGNSINGGTEDGIIEIKGGTVDGNKITLSVSPSVDSVDLFGKITLSEGFSWQLYADYACETRIPTQMAESLDDGVNLYYIVVLSSDGRTKRTYTLLIYKNYYTNIYFCSDSGVLLDTWTNVLSRTTLNDHSDISYQGYTYSDFNCEDWCVTEKDKRFYAGKATPNTYTITLNPSGGSVSSKTKQVTYDDNFTLEVPIRTGYIFLGWYDGDTKVTYNTGRSCGDYLYTYDKTLTAKWEINEYNVTLNTSGGGGTVSGAGKYDHPSRVTITATTNAGYTWLGWYDGTTKVSENLTYTFTMPAESKTYIAKWTISAEMQNFKFTNTSTTCTITGIKDKTVTSIVVPDYVTEISAGAFRGCSSLESLTIPFVGASKDGTLNTLFGYIFGAESYLTNDDYVPTSLKTVVITGGTTIGYCAFESCDSITSITIPDSVTSIGERAFYCCTNLTSINIPASVTSIGEMAFAYCDSLTSITIPDSVTSIGSEAFDECSNLKSVTFGKNSRLITIGDRAFCDCVRLTSIVIPDSVTTIGEHAFSCCNGLTSIVIPDSVINIGESTFDWCLGLTDVYYTGTKEQWKAISIGSDNYSLTNATIHYNYVNE